MFWDFENRKAVPRTALALPAAKNQFYTIKKMLYVWLGCIIYLSVVLCLFMTKVNKFSGNDFYQNASFTMKHECNCS